MPNIHADSEGRLSQMVLASETAEVTTILLELRHRSLAEPIRLSSDMTELYGYDENTGDPRYRTRSMGHDWIYGPFDFIPPGNDEQSSATKGKLTVANADDRILQAVRDVHNGITLKGWGVLASDPDYVLTEFPKLWLESVDYDAASFTATLGFRTFLEGRCPCIKILPRTFPGSYRGGGGSG